MTRSGRRWGVWLGAVNVIGVLIGTWAMSQVGGSALTNIVTGVVLVGLAVALTLVEVWVIRALFVRRR